MQHNSRYRCRQATAHLTCRSSSSVPHKADFVLLAGYLKLIPVELCRAFPRAMLNIHPGLLPSFGGKGYYGERVHKAVIASGARFSGPTVHFVDAEYDTGPILAQRVVPVFPTDTPKQLAARVLKEEHAVYPVCVAALVDGRVGWREDGVPILWEGH
jgi:phosphoribosylglycinamide formyltransferase